MKITERMDRNNTEDQIIIGQAVEGALGGEFGYVLKAMMEGIKERRVKLSQDDFTVPADRTLGWIEALSQLADDLDICIQIKNEHLAERKEGAKINTGEANG